MLKQLERFWDRKQRLQKEQEETARVNQEAEFASSIISDPTSLLNYLEKQYPNEIPNHEVSSWELGNLRGKQDVIRLLKHLIDTSQK